VIVPLGRRDFVRRLVLLGGGVCGGSAALSLGGAGVAAAQGVADLSVVLNGVALEQALSVAYAGIARRARIGSRVRGLLGELADHERQHAAALLALAEKIGGIAPPMPSLSTVEAALPGVRTAVDDRSALSVLETLERAELLGFYSDLAVISDLKLIQLVGAVTCGDAQHLVLVREAAGVDPIPFALETGLAR